MTYFEIQKTIISVILVIVFAKLFLYIFSADPRRDGEKRLLFKRGLSLFLAMLFAGILGNVTAKYLFL